jgi:putative Holliday junction resolvase
VRFSVFLPRIQYYKEMGRILAIDYGKKRTGIAVTDTLQIIANGLTTIPTHELEKFLVDYIQKEDVELFVIGLPTQTNGQPSENQERVKQLTEKLKSKIPNIPTVFHDERFTSVLAHQAIIDSGIKKKKRQEKGLVDEISATIILQSYMEQKRLGF